MKYTFTTTPVITPLLRCITNIILKIIGWKKAGQMPDIRQCVIIAAHHTSMLDGFIGALYVTSFGTSYRASWIGKKELFRWPFRTFLRWLGGIPLDRDRSSDTVRQAAALFKEYESLWLLVIPEGTRKKTEYWKTGFYHIAREAGVPIVCIFGDYKRKEAGFGPVLDPQKMDIDEVFDALREFYRDRTARYPDQVGPVRRKPD